MSRMGRHRRVIDDASRMTTKAPGAGLALVQGVLLYDRSPSPLTRPATLATVATNSEGSNGFETCT
jgi:hypothetical protein